MQVQPRIKCIIHGVNMALGHEGLMLLIKKQTGLDVRTLPANEFVLCINNAYDKYKALAGGGVLLPYFRMPKGRKLMREAIQYLPKTLGGTGFTYDDACKEALKKVDWNRKLRLSSNSYQTNQSFMQAFNMTANKQTIGVKEAPST